MSGIKFDGIFDNVYFFGIKSWAKKDGIVKSYDSNRTLLFLLIEWIDLNVTQIDFVTIRIWLVFYQIHKVFIIH